MECRLKVVFLVKVCLVKLLMQVNIVFSFLISILIKNNYFLLDSQFYNPHLVQFGAYEILDEEYQKKLKFALKKKYFPKKLLILNLYQFYNL